MTVLVGYDATAASRRAVDEAAAEARLRGTSLRIVHVLEHDAGDSPTRARSELDLSERAQAELETIVEVCERHGVEASSAVLHSLAGGAAQTLLEEAESCDADVIVLGLRPRPTIEKVLMGSVAREVARHAPCPVLVVKADTDRGGEGEGRG